MSHLRYNLPVGFGMEGGREGGRKERAVAGKDEGMDRREGGRQEGRLERRDGGKTEAR